MLKNYFLVATRNLTKHRFFSSINIFGLSLSMSVCLGIIMLVADQLQYDRYNSKRNRVHRLVTQRLTPDGAPAGNEYATSPLPLASTLVEEYSGVEKAVRIRRGFGNGWMGIDQDLSIPLAGLFVDPAMLDVFEYELQYGDPATALVQPYSVVLTRKAADKLFKNENPVGEIITVGKLGDFTVTGVIKEKETKSHIVFEALASFSTIKALEDNNTFTPTADDWGNFTAGWVYVVLNGDIHPNHIQTHLNEIARSKKPNPAFSNEERTYRFRLQSLTEITPGPFLNNPIGPFMPQMFVYFFGGLALIVMITSCFNYTNLSIARSLSRAKEIGIRKVNGANRLQIFSQFLTEAIILSFMSLLFALVLLVLVKPFLLNLKFAQVLKWDLEGNTVVYVVFLVFSIVVGLMAGFFPAVILSKFDPIRVLKKIGSIKLFSKLTLRKSLLVFQFSLSLIFIISVLVVYNQLTFFMKADHGFDMSSHYVIKLNSTSYQNLKQELDSYSNVINTAGASHVPASGMVLGQGYKKSLSDEEFLSFSYYNVDENYLDNLSIKLLAGRNFEPSESNTNFVLINEQAVKKLSFAGPSDALGEVIFSSEDSSRYEIIGVVADYNHEILVSKIGPLALHYRPDGFSLLQVKYAGSAQQASTDIEEAWSKINPTQKIDFNDFEDEVKGIYKTVLGDFVSIIGVISLMAIAIACLGLFGMATYTIETRVKEIAIRKVLGSDDKDLVVLLSKGFLMLLFFAIVVAVPIAWFLNNLWLQNIAYRTAVNAEVIGIGVLILLLLGAITIGSQTLRAAYSNPVANLKND